jgi:protocatechuate 3,4-dioxygenase beta subunit
MFVIMLAMLVVGQKGLCQLQADIVRLENSWSKQPAQYSYYQDLDHLLNVQYQTLTAEQRSRIRTTLGKSTFSSIATYSPGERGIRIVIKGTVLDKNKEPVEGAKVVTFQTDASGSYAPTDSITRRMSESDSRLYGVLCTDHEGHFEIHTIRPGTYSVKYEGRFLPQHVHVQVTAKGYVPISLQLVFEDDPAMKDVHWQNWAKSLGFPVLKLIPLHGVPTATPVITLQE